MLVCKYPKKIEEKKIKVVNVYTSQCTKHKISPSYFSVDSFNEKATVS